jgi:diguanylate cyclase (GGDEF)-like protein
VRHDNLALVTTQSRSLEFEQAASVDALTGLHNRRWMMDAFPRAIHRCQRDGRPLCLIMADIDFFKHFNDRYGHLTGDAVLRRVAGQLAGSLRTQDLIARYGGEEFAVLLPETSTAEALEIAHRLRAAVATTGIDGDEDGISLSCGVALLRAGGDLDGLMAAADRALYRAKATGRNRVELAGED